MSSAHVTGTRLHQPSIVTFNQKDELHFCRRRNIVVVVHGGKEKFFECMKNENVMMALALQYVTNKRRRTYVAIMEQSIGNLSSHSFS